MEIRQLKYFISAAEHLSFTSAARECYVVTSAITQQIGNLEDELGVRLFERQPKGIELTEAGKALLDEARRLVAEQERVLVRMTAFRAGYRFTLRVGYAAGTNCRDLTEILRSMRASKPDTKVLLYQLPHRALIEGLEEGHLDVIFGIFSEEEKQQPNFHFALLKQERVMVAVSSDHPFAQAQSISLEELKSQPFITHGKRSVKPGKAEMSLNNFWEGEHYADMQDVKSIEIMVASGYAVSMWSSGHSSEIDNPSIRFIPIRDSIEWAKLAIGWRGEKPSEDVMTFVEKAISYYHGQG